jgi:membrane associated rhomboid family serine protease
MLTDFCHLSPTHLFFNCLGYHTLLSNANMNKIQTEDIIKCLLLCGVGSTLGHILVSKKAVLGASGSVIGLMTFQTFLFPSQKYTIFFPFYGCVLSSLEILVILFSTNLLGCIFFSKRLCVAWIGHLVAHILGGVYALLYMQGKDPFFYSRVKSIVYQFFRTLKYVNYTYFLSLLSNPNLFLLCYCATF